jgi:D-alanyl-D-alanine carboxypeptidase
MEARMKFRISAATLTTLLFIGTVYPQGINKAKLDSLFDVLAQKDKAMGSVAISKNGELLYARAIGYSLISDKEKVPATIATKYRIGSITKMFTATMILQLVEEGKLTLTTRLDKFFPSLPNADSITMANLLNHRSGLHNFTDDSDYVSWMTQPKTEDDLLAIVSKDKPDFQPGAKFAYSNTNYLLLGFIIEKITGESYAKNLKERIVSKIGLHDTYLGGKVDIPGGECYSYTFDGSWKQQPVTDMSVPGGAGAIVSTPTDLTKFIEALFALKLVSHNSLQQMCTMIDGYGMGMIRVPFYARYGYGHTGGIDGFRSMLVFFPEDSLAVAYCTNGAAYSPNDIMIGVLSIYYNMPYSIPTFVTVVYKAENLDRYPGVYSSTQMPLKITITEKDSALVGQATGQSSFPLTATGKDKFEFEPAGIMIQFDSTATGFTLKQGPGDYLFTKEK